MPLCCIQCTGTVAVPPSGREPRRRLGTEPELNPLHIVALFPYSSPAQIAAAKPEGEGWQWLPRRWQWRKVTARRGPGRRCGGFVIHPLATHGGCWANSAQLWQAAYPRVGQAEARSDEFRPLPIPTPGQEAESVLYRK